MELKLARTELTGKPKTVSLQKVLETLKNDGNSIIYFDKTNTHKALMEAIKEFEGAGYSVYFREVRYGLDADDYLYQVHLL